MGTACESKTRCTQAKAATRELGPSATDVLEIEAAPARFLIAQRQQTYAIDAAAETQCRT